MLPASGSSERDAACRTATAYVTIPCDEILGFSLDVRLQSAVRIFFFQRMIRVGSGRHNSGVPHAADGPALVSRAAYVTPPSSRLASR